MRKKLKIIIPTIIIILIVASCVASKTGGNKGSKKDKGTTVRTEMVKPGELVEIVVAPGEIEPRKKVDISAKVAARIIEMPFDEGEQVKEGDLLIQLDARDLESRLRAVQASHDAQRAQLEVDKARIEQQKASLQTSLASYEQAKADFERQKKLLATKDISQATFDEYESTLEEQEGRYFAAKHGLAAAGLGLVVMEHNLKAAKERIEQAKEELNYTTITSPMDGIVTRINAEVGEMVMTGTMNNRGTIIMQVADLSQMLLVAQVDEADIGKMSVGQKANIRVQAYWGHEFKGTVDTIALTHDSRPNSPKYYKTEILINADEEHPLFSGLTADVDIETLRHENVLKVPTQAVVSRKVDDLPLEIRENNPNVDMAKTDALVVYRLVEGKAIATPVQIGESDMTHIIIHSGLSEDDRVVVGPYKVLDKLKHEQVIADEKDKAQEKNSNKDGKKEDGGKEEDEQEEDAP